MNNLKYIILLMYLLFVDTSYGQMPTLTISNVKVNGQPITNNTIEFGNLSQITVRYQVDFVKPENLTLGNVSYVNGVQNNNGFVQLFTPQNFNIPAGNTGFTDIREYDLYASNYSLCNDQYLSAELTLFNANVTYYSNHISIKRNAQFDLTTTTNPINCGSPVLLKANALDCLSGSSVLYYWTIGNGWILPNGSPSPSTLTSSTNTISLIPINSQPSPVSVIPKVNGVASLSSSYTVSLTPFTTTASISGANSICSGSSTYTVTGLPAGVTASNWQSSNTAVATVSSSGVVTAVGTGTVTISRTLTNACGQTTPITKTVYIGAPAVAVSNSVVGSSSVYANTSSGYSVSAVPGTSFYSWSIVAINPSCSTGLPKFMDNNSSTISTTTPSTTINWGNCKGTYVVNCSATNSCASAGIGYKQVEVLDSSSDPCAFLYSLGKNPIQNGEAITYKVIGPPGPCPETNKEGMQRLATVKQHTIKVSIFNLLGTKMFEKEIVFGGDEFSIEDLKLSQGKYIVHIEEKNTIKKEIIIIN